MIRDNVNNNSYQILMFLESNPHGITPMDAFDMFGITRLAAQIWSLKQQGYEIKANIEHSVRSDGRKIKYARYYLE